MSTVFTQQNTNAFSIQASFQQDESVNHSTEFNAYQGSPTGLPLLLRTLKTLSEQKKWIIFLGKESLLNRNIMAAAGIDLSKIRVLKHVGQLDKTIDAISESGNYSAVISCKKMHTYFSQEDMLLITLTNHRQSCH